MISRLGTAHRIGHAATVPWGPDLQLAPTATQNSLRSVAFECKSMKDNQRNPPMRMDSHSGMPHPPILRCLICVIRD